MVSGTDLFYGLFNNLAIFIVLVAVYGLLINNIEKVSVFIRQAMIGFSFGLFAIGCMYAKIPVAEGVIVDQRNTIITLCGGFGGPLSAIIGALMAGAFRIYLGGTGALSGVVGICLSALGGSILFKFRDKIDTLPKAAFCSLAATILILPGWLFYKDINTSWGLLKTVALPYGSAIFLGIFFVGLLLARQEYSRLARIELIKSEKSLKKSEQRLDLALSGANEGIWDWNLQNSKIHFDTRYYTISGYSPNEFPNRSDEWEARIHPDDIQKVRSLIQSYLSGEAECYDHEFRFKHKKGHYMWVNSKGKIVERDEQGQPVRFAGTYSDITKRKQIEDSLRINQFIFEKASIGIYRIGSDARIFDVNRQVALDLGYTAEELCQMSIFDIDPYFKPEEWKEFWQTLCRMGSTHDQRIHRRKDGSEIFVEINLNILEYGGTRFSVVFTQDITDRKNVEKEAKRLESALVQAQRMEAIGTLAGGIAHDFNNILGAIVGYTQLTQMKAKENPTIQKYTNQICIASERAKGLIQQILAFSRQAKIEKRAVDISVIIKEALTLIRASIPSTIEIRQYIKNNIGAVEANQTQIHQVILNLCTNAAHAMDENGGRLTVNLEPIEISEINLPRFYDLKPGHYLKLGVTDTGHGMDAYTISRIFEPYFTTKQVGEGTGMGLATVHGIVKDHGGDIKVDSEPGVGTTFSIFFPVIEESSEKTEMIAMDSFLKGKGRILFVDDEKPLVDIGKDMLESLGYQVETRTSPSDALEALRAQPDKYDLVLTDMTMPQMNGDKLAEEIKKISTAVPIVICTGFSKRMSHEKAMEMGISGILMKPITLVDLASMVNKVLNTPGMV